LVAELDRIAFVLCDELAAHYQRYRHARIADQGEFVSSIQDLKSQAFLMARAVECGECEIRSVISIFNWLARLDLMVHQPDLEAGHHKATKDVESGFASRFGDHQKWREAFEEESLKPTRKKRPATVIARAVIAKLGIKITEKHLCRLMKAAELSEK
jgi:hypothetical protein